MDKLGLKYKHPYNLGNKFQCDFAFPDKKVIVEADGTYWHSLSRNKHFDKLKKMYCESHGWNLLRFTDYEIKKQISNCITTICDLLARSS